MSYIESYIDAGHDQQDFIRALLALFANQFKYFWYPRPFFFSPSI